MENMNSKEYLLKCRNVILENLRFLEAAPSVAFQDVPPDWAVRDAEDELRAAGGSANPDVRPGAHTHGQVVMDGRREHAAEFYDGEGDHDHGRGDGGDGPAAAVASAGEGAGGGAVGLSTTRVTVDGLPE